MLVTETLRVRNICLPNPGHKTDSLTVFNMYAKNNFF